MPDPRWRSRGSAFYDFDLFGDECTSKRTGKRVEGVRFSLTASNHLKSELSEKRSRDPIVGIIYFLFISAGKFLLAFSSVFGSALRAA